jgi:hypothetical protein
MRLGEIVLAMMKKDWNQRAKGFLTFFAGMMALQFVPNDQWKLGGMAVVVVTSAFYYAYYNFTTEFNRRTMPMLLGLPVRPGYLILGKLASMYSMCLVTVNVPGALLLDAHLLYLFNAEMLFIATITVAAGVLSSHPLVPMFPIGAILMAFQRQTAFQEFQPYEFKAATIALILTPIIAAGSAWLFGKQGEV